MRPIERGKNTKTFSKYPQARGDLIDRLGEYCSYCEGRLPASLAVEHVQPKSIHPALEKKWSNFLLACTNCNSTKGHKKIKLKDYLWPDSDNTFLALRYNESGRITVNNSLDPNQRRCAKNIIKLTGLFKNPGNTASRSDRRWINRKEAWRMATRSLANLKRNNTKAMREQIVYTAQSRGYWSIWMTVFKDDPDMLNRFIHKFTGTSKKCFDQEGHPKLRKGGTV